MLETLSFVEGQRLLHSRSSLETRAVFVEALKSPQLVASPSVRDDDATSVEVIRGRLDALAKHDVCDLPARSPVGAIGYATSQLAGYQWVDVGPLGGRRNPVSVLPYSGPGWAAEAPLHSCSTLASPSGGMCG